MIRSIRNTLAALLITSFIGSAAHAQEPVQAEAKAAEKAESKADAGKAQEAKKDRIMSHVLNSHELAVPSLQPGLEREVELPRWAPIHIGKFELDLSPTKHVVMLWIAGTLCLIVMLLAAAGAKKAHAQNKHSTGLAGAIEAMVLYLRSEVLLPNLGHGGEGFVPFCLSLFFMVLFCNLLGLIPYMATATGNISVTATLAFITFLVVEISGIVKLKGAYANTILYWPHDLPLLIRVPVSLIMTPVEFLGKLTKPFALAMRLFANMTAGHIAVLSLIALTFTIAQLVHYNVFLSGLGAVVPVLLSTGIMCLEVFVAFLQAFIFMLLSAVFIGMIRESHH
jgi:F-type H+-transporting ATPase subunit a